MENTNNVYFLNGKIVDEKLWTDTLNECIATVQNHAHDPETKKTIRVAVMADIESGRISVVNGREFGKLVREA